MSKNSACKIYCLPVDGGKFVQVPVVEYQQPERSWQERWMDKIGDILLATTIAGLVSLVFIQIVIRMYGRGF